MKNMLGGAVLGALADIAMAAGGRNTGGRYTNMGAEAGAKAFWMQLGLHSDEAAQIADDAGLDVVSNRCVKIEHARFHGGLHLAGFDTGVISSKRTRD